MRITQLGQIMVARHHNGVDTLPEDHTVLNALTTEALTALWDAHQAPTDHLPRM